jgi:LmbE family N-acetylglucosaminyl deacetylase
MSVLIIAPHADDEIIGVGGTICKHIANGDKVYICVVTKGVEPLFSQRYMIQLRNESLKCHELLGITKTYYFDFPSVMLEKENRYEINDKLVNLIQDIKPEVVYIPHFGDMQKDHQIVTEAAMVALRPKYKHRVNKIYAYETLSETGWNIPNVANAFIPNFYMDISGFFEKKIEAMKCYGSQLSQFPDARSIEAIEHIARYRGSTINVQAAEAFMLIREIL